MGTRLSSLKCIVQATLQAGRYLRSWHMGPVYRTLRAYIKLGASRTYKSINHLTTYIFRALNPMETRAQLQRLPFWYKPRNLSRTFKGLFFTMPFTPKQNL